MNTLILRSVSARSWLGGIFSLLLGVAPATLVAQSDDFDDGNDAGWTHYDPLGGLGAGPRSVFSFPSGGYRIQALSSPSPAAAGPGRVAGLRDDATYTRFYITVDVVGWDDSLNQAFGPLARIGTPGLGLTTGYGFTYQNRGHDVQLSSITAERATAISPVVSVTLDPTKRYRFVFSGNGSAFRGSIYLASDLTTPLAVATGTSSSYLSGTAGLLVYANSSTGTGDATFDNYVATDVEAPKLTYEYNASFQDFTLRWPLDYAGWILESTASFTPLIMWANLSADVVIDAGQYSYFDSTAMGNKFFRLRRP